MSAFSDQAVTALGLYYKWQTFFFIPLGAMQTCIVPIISFNYAAGKIGRCKKTLTSSIDFGLALMFLGTLCFLLVPSQTLRVFISDALVIEIGRIGFRYVGVSFIPMVTSLIFPVFFPSVRLQPEELALDGDSYGGAICPVGICVLKIWTGADLADVSGNGGYHQGGGLRLLSAVPEK